MVQQRPIARPYLHVRPYDNFWHDDKWYLSSCGNYKAVDVDHAKGNIWVETRLQVQTTSAQGTELICCIGWAMGPIMSGVGHIGCGLSCESQQT